MFGKADILLFRTFFVSLGKQNFKAMKIAVPTRNNMIDDHFGHCDHYTLFTIEQGAVIERTTLPSPQGCGCKSNIASTLEELGVSVMLAGNMGEGAKNKLESHNIKVIRGCSGMVESVVEAYIKGFVFDSGVGCHAHDCADKH